MKNISIMGQEEKLVITEPSSLQKIAYGDIFAVVYDSPYAVLHTSGALIADYTYRAFAGTVCIV